MFETDLKFIILKLTLYQLFHDSLLINRFQVHCQVRSDIYLSTMKCYLEKKKQASL